MNFFSKLKFLPLSTKEKPTHTVEKLLGRSFFTHFSGNLWLISEHIIDIPEDGLVFSKPSNRQVNFKKNRDLRNYWPGRPCSSSLTHAFFSGENILCMSVGQTNIRDKQRLTD